MMNEIPDSNEGCAYFAQLNEKNEVVTVLVIDENDTREKARWWNPIEWVKGGKKSEAVGIAWCQNHIKDPDSRWLQTEHGEAGYCMRVNPASRENIYLTGVRTLGVASTDIFIEPQPYPSWSVGIHTARWYWPQDVPHPNINTRHQYVMWNENNYQKDPSTAWEIRTKEKGGGMLGIDI